MNSLANIVTLIGNLGIDPDVKTTEKGKKVVHFTLATNDGYKTSDGQKVNETTWHNITAWNGLAELAGQYLKKGSKVVVEGRLTYRSYEDKNKVTRNVTEVVVNDLLFLKNTKGGGKEESDKDE